MSGSLWLWSAVALLLALASGVPVGSLAGSAVPLAVLVTGLLYVVGLHRFAWKTGGIGVALLLIAMFWPAAARRVTSAEPAIEGRRWVLPDEPPPIGAIVVLGTLVIGTSLLGHYVLWRAKAGVAGWIRGGEPTPRRPRLRRDAEPRPRGPVLPRAPDNVFDLFGDADEDR